MNENCPGRDIDLMVAIMREGKSAIEELARGPDYSSIEKRIREENFGIARQEIKRRLEKVAQKFVERSRCYARLQEYGKNDEERKRRLGEHVRACESCRGIYLEDLDIEVQTMRVWAETKYADIIDADEKKIASDILDKTPEALKKELDILEIL